MQYIKVSDVVNELSVARQDDSRTEWLRLMILSKSVLRELKLKYLNDFSRVYLPIDQATMTVRLPLDFQRFRTISLIEECRDNYGNCSEKVIPLTHNPYINITPQPTEALSTCDTCKCTPTHPVCSELSSYTELCEEVMIDPNSSPPLTGTKQTVLRTCANGDIIKEVTEPVLKFIEGDMICDYEIEVSYLRSICDYDLEYLLVVDVAFLFTVTYTLNGETITSAEFVSYAEIQAYFESLGWTAVSNKHYTLDGVTDVYGDTFIFTYTGTGAEQSFMAGRHCEEENIITFPYTIVNYTVNGVVISESPAEIGINNQADQDEFFADLGFTKVFNTDSPPTAYYIKQGSEDVYFNIVVDLYASPPESPQETYQVNFIQTNCHRLLVNDGISNATTTDVLCNVPVHEGCGCILESEETIATICGCCAPFLNCCQDGQLTGYSGWGYVPSNCPTNSPMPYNKKGTFSIDEINYIIYLDSVCASKVLLSYDNDGSCSGDYAFPDYMLEAFKSGLAWKHAQYNEEITPFRRRELKMNFQEELSKLSREFTDVIYMADLIGALKTGKTPY